jgi:UDP-3-O-[3-hydroxymyristoyl] glucosamine N-acyltransferase
MQHTAGELAQMLKGSVEGDPQVVVNALAKIEDASAGSLTFLSNPDYEGYLYTTGASVAIVPKTFQPTQSLPISLVLIRVEDSYAAFAQLLEVASASMALPRTVHASAVISASAQVHDDVYIGPLVVIEDGAVISAGCEIHAHATVGRNVKIGENSTLHSGVKVLDNCIIGKKCIVQAGAIIGSDGFGFAPQAGDGYTKVPQTGNVVLHDSCEIGAATTIDRATLGSTVIGEGVKLDNQIQVAHNCTIGAHTVIAAQTGIAGSTTIGSGCMIGGQVGFAGHLKIADGVKVAAQSGVTTSIKEPNSIWQGTPATPIKYYQKQQIALRNLSRHRFMNRLEELEKTQRNARPIA